MLILKNNDSKQSFGPPVRVHDLGYASGFDAGSRAACERISSCVVEDEEQSDICTPRDPQLTPLL